MAVTFFTSRVILDKLGVVDFGIQNVVGGVATLFVFFRSSLSNATQRYLSVALGKKDLEYAQQIVQQHHTIYMLIGMVSAVLAELFGMWLVSKKLVIPPDRIVAAQWVLQFAIIGFVVNICNVTPHAIMVAHENFRIYSYIGVVEAVAKLGIAYVISVVSFDRLITYSLLLLLVNLGVLMFNAVYTKIRYEECSYRPLWIPALIKDMFGFIGWNVFGTAVYTLNDAGINLLLNMFFGPVVNAARGVAFQVSNAVNQFGQNFFTAVRPQIFKSYTENNKDLLLSLFYRSSKYTFFLLWLIILPVMLKVDTILGLWLREVPHETNVFLIWVLAYSLVNALVEPIWAMMLAVGKLKKYSIIGNSVFIMIFPISYFFLKAGATAVSVFTIAFAVRFVYVFVVLFIVSQFIKFSVQDYLRKVFLPIIVVICLASLCSRFICGYFPNTFIGLLFTVIITLLVNILFISLAGMTTNERASFILILKSNKYGKAIFNKKAK